jgi:hypothetical protein
MPCQKLGCIRKRFIFKDLANIEPNARQDQAQEFSNFPTLLMYGRDSHGYERPIPKHSPSSRKARPIRPDDYDAARSQL